MRTILALLVSLALLLLGCSVDTTPPGAPTDAATELPDVSTDGSPEATDPYPYACCPFADEGLTEFDACCTTWRAEHDGG